MFLQIKCNYYPTVTLKKLKHRDIKYLVRCYKESMVALESKLKQSHSEDLSLKPYMTQPPYMYFGYRQRWF